MGRDADLFHLAGYTGMDIGSKTLLHLSYQISFNDKVLFLNNRFTGSSEMLGEEDFNLLGGGRISTGECSVSVFDSRGCTPPLGNVNKDSFISL